jgi:hypothetical protein
MSISYEYIIYSKKSTIKTFLNFVTNKTGKTNENI